VGSNQWSSAERGTIIPIRQAGSNGGYHIEQTSRVELGRRYAELKYLIRQKQLGNNPKTGHKWSWRAWTAIVR
jgi:hypothetical protein